MQNKALAPVITIDKVEKLNGADLDDLCQITEQSMEDGLGFTIGFKYLTTPAREKLESYWKGVLQVPERELYVGRLDGSIASSIQLIKPAPSNQSQSFAVFGREHFVAPWARGHGLAKMLLGTIEDSAKRQGYKILKLEVRGTQAGAIALYENHGYRKWGELDKYEFVDGNYVAGYFYYKDLL
jgi:ribosomal protein S18 acetylase RimI-like enzyme